MKFIRVTITAMIVLLGVSFSSMVLSDDNQKESFKHTNLKKRLTDKYKKIRDVSSTLMDTPYGPQGRISIDGEMNPDKVPVVEGEHAWERGMARGFIEQEATLLGIKNMDEIQEKNFRSGVGYYGKTSNVYFHRVINGLVLENSDVQVTVDTTRNVSSVMADVAPAPPELYEATKKSTLSEVRIRKIIENNLITPGVKGALNINKIEKHATSTPPYVIWVVDVHTSNKHGRWDFRIDAFTGEILEKRDALIRD